MIIDNKLNLTERLSHFADRLQQNVTLSKYNTWHVGGTADYVFKPESELDLQCFLSELYNIDKDINILWLGLGSNVLIRDGGYRGVIILTNSGKDSGLNLIEQDHYRINVGAGIACAKLAKFCATHKYPTGAFWAGIPGTVGGALAMNAGCYGYETWDFVKKVQMIGRNGEMITLSSNDFDISYRHTKLVNDKYNDQDYWFTSAVIEVPKDDSICGKQQIKELLKKRSDAQPIGQFSGGSVFKNPKNNHSAKLIQEAGLKGYQIGGAHVSTKHANFIVNDKTAKASDIEGLINHIQHTVYDKFNIKLEPEVKIIGERS